jgi:hypothetical protein
MSICWRKVATLASRSGPAAKPPDRCFVGEVAGNAELHLLVVPQRKALRFRLVEAGNVADRAGSDQGLDHGGAERPGTAGNDNVTIAEVHKR